MPKPPSKKDPMTMNNLMNASDAGLQRVIIANALLSRKQLLSKLLDPRKDINDECGYPDKITPLEYKTMFDRESIATRVVNVLPNECWESQPDLFEDEDPSSNTEFEQAWLDSALGIRGQSWFQDKEGSPFWEMLHRADILCGVGHFGLLLLGVDDGKPLEEPLEGINDDGTSNKNRADRTLLYMRAFDESLIDITAYEKDFSNPRFGQPLTYSVKLNDPSSHTQMSTGMDVSNVTIHWSRLVHLADNLGSDEVFGVPRMRPVFNRLMDLRKVYGGSAEMYWRGAFPGLSIETDPSLGGDVEVDADTIKDGMENYMNGLQRYLMLTGFSAKSLAPQVVDPASHIDVYLTAISILLGVPKRILMGTERGELSSGQDDDKWNDRLNQRRNNFVTPRIIVPTIDHMIKMGILPQPAQGYSVAWPELGGMSPTEKSAVLLQRTEAMVKFIGGGADQLMEPMDYLTREMGYTDDEADSILKSAEQRLIAEEQFAQRGLQEEEDDFEETPSKEPDNEAA